MNRPPSNGPSFAAEPGCAGQRALRLAPGAQRSTVIDLLGAAPLGGRRHAIKLSTAQSTTSSGTFAPHGSGWGRGGADRS